MPGFLAEVVHSVVGGVDFIIDTTDLDLDGGEMVSLFVVKYISIPPNIQEVQWVCGVNIPMPSTYHANP